MSLRPLLLLAGLALAHPASAQAPEAPLAARDLPRGTVLSRADVAAGEAGAAEVQAVVGSVTRRVVARGEPLRAPAIAPRDVVAAGDVVELVWREGDLELRMRGRALGSAAAGEQVGVRVDVKRRFAGVVVGPGVVRIEQIRENR